MITLIVNNRHDLYLNTQSEEEYTAPTISNEGQSAEPSSYVNGFLSNISSDYIQGPDSDPFKRKSTERSSSFFRGLLPRQHNHQDFPQIEIFYKLILKSDISLYKMGLIYGLKGSPVAHIVVFIQINDFAAQLVA